MKMKIVSYYILFLKPDYLTRSITNIIYTRCYTSFFDMHTAMKLMKMLQIESSIIRMSVPCNNLAGCTNRKPLVIKDDKIIHSLISTLYLYEKLSYPTLLVFLKIVYFPFAKGWCSLFLLF